MGELKWANGDYGCEKVAKKDIDMAHQHRQGKHTVTSRPAVALDPGHAWAVRGIDNGDYGCEKVAIKDIDMAHQHRQGKHCTYLRLWWKVRGGAPTITELLAEKNWSWGLFFGGEKYDSPMMFGHEFQMNTTCEGIRTDGRPTMISKINRTPRLGPRPRFIIAPFTFNA